MKLREVGEAVGGELPQTVKYHLDILLRKGLLEKTKNGSIRPVGSNNEIGGLIHVPILGSANAGEALIYAEDEISGFLPVSPSMLKTRNYSGLFCVIASGRSMNAANVNGVSIQDGDFVIAEKKNPFSYRNGDYIVTTFDGRANIKRFIRDHANGYIVLQSESLDHLPPIYISEDDTDRFQIHGEVIQVLHSPENTSRNLTHI